MEHLYTSAIFGFVSIIILIFFFLIRRNSSNSSFSKLPPEASGKWPIIGHLFLLGGSELPHKTLSKLADKHGPIFLMHVGVHRTLVINSHELAKECFTTNDLAISNRPKLISAEIFGWNQANFGFAPMGTFWREMRKILATELLSNSRLEKLRHVRDSAVESLVKDLYKVWGKWSESEGGSRVGVKMEKWIGDMSLNVIMSIVVGKRFSSGSEEEEEAARRCRELMRELFRLAGLFLVGDAIPFLRWLDLGGHEKALNRIMEELESMAEECLEEHRRRRKESGIKLEGDHEKDLMDVMMNILESADLAGFDVDTVNKATCMGIIISGADTTTVTIVWALCSVLNNPRVLKKLQDELDCHVGKERLVNESDITNLVYLHAVVKETLRIYPAAPLSGPREFTQDCTIGGYRVPKGTRLITNLWKIQTDPRVWSDPLEFKPERFLNIHSDVDVKGKHFELIPFGAGRRSCPGITYGLQMTHLMLASLLQAFDVESVGPVDMTATFGLTNAKATPLDVLIKPRLPHSLYA